MAKYVKFNYSAGYYETCWQEGRLYNEIILSSDNKRRSELALLISKLPER